MGALPERVAYLEGQMAEQSQMLVAIREDIQGLGQRLDKGMERLDQRMDGLDQRMDGLDQRMDGLDQRMDGLDQRMDRLDGRIDRLDGRIDRLDGRIDSQGQRTEQVYESLNDKMSRQFLWLVGIQVTTLLVIISTILARG
jgi:chromosome segregation ATPase